MIYVPYLYIDYRERKTSYVQQNPTTTVQIDTDYKMYSAGFMELLNTSFWICISLMSLIIILKCCIESSRPRLGDDEKLQSMFVRTFVNAIDYFSAIFFWFIFAMTGWWFIFFKLQERVYCFLPSLDEYYTLYYQYDWLFGWVAGSKLVYMLFKIYFDQSLFDVYLIDWERPKISAKAQKLAGSLPGNQNDGQN